jgi:hypothetical protein
MHELATYSCLYFTMDSHKKAERQTNAPSLGVSFLEPVIPKTYGRRKEIPTVVGKRFLRSWERDSYGRGKEIPTVVGKRFLRSWERGSYADDEHRHSFGAHGGTCPSGWLRFGRSLFICASHGHNGEAGMVRAWQAAPTVRCTHAYHHGVAGRLIVVYIVTHKLCKVWEVTKSPLKTSAITNWRRRNDYFCTIIH